MSGRSRDQRPTSTTSPHDEIRRAIASDRPISGIERGAENADDWFRSCFNAALNAMIAGERPFSISDMQALGLPSPDHHTRWGSLMAAAERHGRIISVGASLNPWTGRPQRVWVGSGLGEVAA